MRPPLPFLFFLASPFHPLVSSSSSPPAQEETQVLHPDFIPTTRTAPFLEQFGPDWKTRWTPSEATRKADDNTDDKTKNDAELRYRGEWNAKVPHVFPGFENDMGLVMETAAAHHAISSQFDKPIDPAGKDLVVQYEVKTQDGLECGGAYVKLLMSDKDGIQAKEFTNETPYVIMFGPDKCGSTNKVHFIFRHKNPKTKNYEEKHLVGAPSPKMTKLSTLYTLIVRASDNTFEIRINNEKVSSGNLLEGFAPPVNPPKEISDPEDKKPADWVDDARIPDPDAVKPADWDEDAPFQIVDTDATKPDSWLEDEEEMIPDPDAKKPSDWDDEEDGEWLSPSIPNPKCEDASGCGKWTTPMKRNPAYKGKWSRPLVDNPAYKGVWAARKIPNPDYFEDKNPANFTPMSGIGLELWTMQANILFDNIYIGHDAKEAEKFAEETWKVKYAVERAEEEKKNGVVKSAQPEHEFSKAPLEFFEEQVYILLSNVLGLPVSQLKEQRFYILAGVTSSIALILFGLFVFVSTLFGGSATKVKASPAATAARKKTDAVTPDDVKEKVLDEESEDENASEAQVKEMEVSTSGLKNRNIPIVEDDDE